MALQIAMNMVSGKKIGTSTTRETAVKSFVGEKTVVPKKSKNKIRERKSKRRSFYVFDVCFFVFLFLFFCFFVVVLFCLFFLTSLPTKPKCKQQELIYVSKPSLSLCEIHSLSLFCFPSSSFILFTQKGLAGLIGGDLLGINEDGDAMPSYHGESRQSQGGWSNAFGSDDGREADELEEEDTLPQVQMPPQMSDLEIAKEEQRADQLLNLVRRLDEKKLKKRKKRKKHEASAYAKLKKQLHSTGSDDDDDEDEEDSSENEFSDDEISAIDWDLMSEAEQELNKEVEGEETASQLLEGKFFFFLLFGFFCVFGFLFFFFV